MTVVPRYPRETLMERVDKAVDELLATTYKDTLIDDVEVNVDFGSTPDD